MESLTSQPTQLTVGPDGTLIGRVGELPFISPLDLFWIERAWESGARGVVGRMCMLQDGLGEPGAVPAGLDYLPAIRASSYQARRAMLRIARRAVPDEAMAAVLGLEVGTLRAVLMDAYNIDD